MQRDSFKLLLSAALISLLTLSSAFWDRSHLFTWRWVTFSGWMTSLALAAAVPFASGRNSTKCDSKTCRTDRVFYTALFLYVLFLASYRLEFLPYLTMGDEIRDGALRAMEIADGSLKDLLAIDNSQTLFFASICSFFNRIFPGSVLTYRIPGALLTLFSVSVLFWGLKDVLSLQARFLAALLYASLPISIFFARSEPLIYASATTALAAVVTFARIAKFNKLEERIWIGLACGIGVSLHASVRPALLIVVFAFGLLELRKLILKELTFRDILISFGWVLGGALIAFGPNLLIFDKILLVGTKQLNTSATTTNFFFEYLKNLRVYFDLPAKGHFEGGLILPGYLVLFVIIGIFATAFAPSPLLLLSAISLPVLTLTNSTLTNMPYGGHRLYTCAIFLAVLIAQGAELLNKIFTRLLGFAGYLPYIGLIAWCVYLPYSYFSSLLTDPLLKNDQKNYFYAVLRYASEYSKQDNNLSSSPDLCFSVPKNSPIRDYLEFPHVKDYLRFAFSNKRLTIAEQDELPSDWGILMSSTCPSKDNSERSTILKLCDGKIRFPCGEAMNRVQLRIIPSERF